jgi:hypothetical protein
VLNTVIKPRQNLLLSRIINPYIYESTLVNNDLPAGLQFNISNSLPVSFIGDIGIDAALTIDEKRDILGYGALENQTITPSDNGTNPTQ